MAVVKADAYGHGDKKVALALREMGVKWYAVSNLDEAIVLRQANISGEILILGYTPVSRASELLDYDITQTLISEQYAKALSECTTHRIKAQFAIDTGMNRIGIQGSDPTRCAEIIRKYHHVFHLTGIFTHLCVADGSDEESVSFTDQQISQFKEICLQIDDLKLPYNHYMNSAAGLRFARTETDTSLVRSGIILYGLKPNSDFLLPKGISPVLSWKTVISLIKPVSPGETIGYGRSYSVNRDMLIATLPTGYADGYSRFLSNKGFVIVHGQKAPIVGKICMDQMMIDITHIPNVREGDEVILLGKEADCSLSADDLAQMIDTIGYEIICGISKRVYRHYL